MSSACCGARPALRLSPFDAFQRGLVTMRQPSLAVVGPRVRGREGVWAAFSLRVEKGCIAALRFTSTNCATLVACCQVLVELNAGCALHTPCVTDASQLWKRLPGMPRAKVDRAVLATRALQLALHQVDKLSVSEGVA